MGFSNTTLAKTVMRFINHYCLGHSKRVMQHLTREKLTTMLRKTGSHIAADYQSMFLKILNLEQVTVEDIMVPRSEIIGIDINNAWDDILEQLTNSQHTRLPIYKDTIDEVLGILHLRKAVNLLAKEKLNKTTLVEVTEKVLFIPEGTSLNVQLLNFRKEKRRIGLVVSEYGDIQGLVTLEDILEEIVGEFTTDVAAFVGRSIHAEKDGSYLVDGSISIRELNHVLHCHLSIEGPKTLSGLIIEYLETIPQAGTALRIGDQPLEIIHVKDNMIKTVRILPKLINQMSLELPVK